MAKRINLKTCLSMSTFLLGLTCTAFAHPFGGGSGTAEEPYLIYTAEQMNAIGANPFYLESNFLLMDDIDLSHFSGNSFNIIGKDYESAFSGIFDGNDHTINNFMYTSTDEDYIGIFGYTRSQAHIRNLHLIDVNIEGGNGKKIGALAGLNCGTISSCSAIGNINGEAYVGGLVGKNGGYVAKIINCRSSMTVSGTGNFVGGLVGNSELGQVTNCYSTGDVTGRDYVGGLIGRSCHRVINCYSLGTVSGADYVGGLVGHHQGHSIAGCYSKADVFGHNKVGGLSGGGTNTHTHFVDCYAAGNVVGTGTDVGGLVGYLVGRIDYCYSTGYVSGASNAGGLVGNASVFGIIANSFWDINASQQSNSYGGIGKTTEQLQNMSTFTDDGWDFIGETINGPSDMWAIPITGDYPILWWQLDPLPPLPAFSGGLGTEGDPYLISNASEFNSIGHNPRLMNAHFFMTNDIDLESADAWIIGSPSYPFSGVFNGNNHTISNFTYIANEDAFIGLFSFVDGKKAEIKNLGLINPSVHASVGGEVGSLVGMLRFGTVTKCYADGGSISGYWNVGGLVGHNRHSDFQEGTITQCWSSCDVSADAFYNSNVGGLVGSNYGKIIECFASGNIIGSRFVGGLVGYQVGRDSIILNCYATGSVSGNKNVGGLIGRSSSAMANRCYSIGNVSGFEYVGGLIGKGFVSDDCFWDIQTSGQLNSYSGIGKTTAEMKTKSTFTSVGWDFNTPIWTIDEGNDYPRLWWEECILPEIEVAMKFTPQALNPGSQGNWVKAHFVLPEGFAVEDVDANTPAILQPGDIPSDVPMNVFINEPNFVEVEAAFDRADFCAAGIDDEVAEVTVTGLLTTGQGFYGTDTIRIIDKRMQYLTALAAHWLEANCRKPDWCNGLDLDQDSVVNFVDFALFDGCCIEFIKQ